jgi:ribosome-associated toxin RatA of RatAB toxin-antitoxin module
MPRHEEQKTLAYTADELFSVVAEVKDYPSFVPWCSGARIRREDPQEIVADLEIGFGPFRESFTSQVTLDRPRQVLGPVDIYRAAITAATRLMLALKLSAVLSYRVAMERNSLILAK